MRKICEIGLKQEYVKYVDQLFLYVMEAMKKSSARKGTQVTQFVCIFVPDEFQAFRQMSSAQAVDTVLETVRRFEANYPETLKCAFVVDGNVKNIHNENAHEIKDHSLLTFLFIFVLLDSTEGI